MDGKSVVLGVGIGVVGMVALAVLTPYAELGKKQSASIEPPGEFLYLDAQRVDAYLGQAERGLSASEKRTLLTARKANASVGTGTAISIGGGLEQQSSTEQVVTRKAADNFVVLNDDLKAQQKSKYRTLRPTRKKFCGFRRPPCRTVREGDFVKVESVRLRVPTYALLLPKLTYASRLPVGPQQHISLQKLPHLLNLHARKIKRYAAAVGAHARVPVIVKGFKRGEGSTPGRTFTFFIPLDYSLLVDSPALLSGNVTVVGKVIRKIDGSGDGATARFRDPSYFDVQAPLTFLHAIEHLPRSVRSVIGIPRGTARERVSATVKVDPPGMVIIPVAIYQ